MSSVFHDMYQIPGLRQSISEARFRWEQFSSLMREINGLAMEDGHTQNEIADLLYREFRGIVMPEQIRRILSCWVFVYDTDDEKEATYKAQTLAVLRKNAERRALEMAIEKRFRSLLERLERDY